jgi:hypothetical protein
MANMNSTTPQAPTMRRRGPGADFRPGAGFEQDDTIGNAISAVQDGVIAIPADDPFAGKVRPAIMAAASALMKVRDVIWSLKDEHIRALIASRDVIVQSVEQTRNSVPVSGWGGPSDYQAARGGAQSRAEQQAAVTTRNVVLAKAGSAPLDAANDFGAKLQSAADEVAFARTRWLGPGAFRGASVSLAELQFSEAVEQQIRATERPMAWCLDYLAQAATRADPDELQRFLRAARTVALEMRATPAPKVAARYPSQGNRLAELEQDGAFTLLNAVEKMLLTTAPASVTVGPDLVAQLAAVGSQLAGVNVAALSSSAFQSRYLDGDRQPESRFEAQADWPIRWMKPELSAGELPGWSPPMAMSSMGGIVRMPKGYAR